MEKSEILSLGQPEDFFVKREFFFDSNYHIDDEVKRHEFVGTDVPEEVIAALPDADGRDRMVEFVYSKWNPSSAVDPRKMAVLFRRIQLE